MQNIYFEKLKRENICQVFNLLEEREGFLLTLRLSGFFSQKIQTFASAFTFFPAILGYLPYCNECFRVYLASAMSPVRFIPNEFSHF